MGSAGQKNAAISLRIEPFLTWTEATSMAELSLSDGRVSFNSQQALITGKVQNDMSGRINADEVVAVVGQKSNGAIVATANQPLTITDSAAPGQILDYSIAVSLPVNLDPAALDTEVSALGKQP